MTTETISFRDALAPIPPGRWVVGVSGGADSVALLRLLREYRPDLPLIVAHLNHESRGEASDGDATFVESLARSLGVQSTVRRLSEIADTPTTNIEASYRDARHRLFASVVCDRQAAGVLLAHHADDRAETTVLRLLRGGEATALAGIRGESVINTLHLRRPLLGLRRAALENYLHAIGQPWRTDTSNATDRFARNRVRRFLETRPDLVAPLLALADAADRLREWTRANAPPLADSFAASLLADLPDPLARASARQWLIARGAPRDDVTSDVAERLVAMTRDRSTPARQMFPGGLTARRRGEVIEIDASPNV